MYLPNSNQLRTPGPMTLEGLSNRIDEIGRILSSCGGLDHNTDGFTFDLYGDSSQDAGKSGDHAILHVNQQNSLAGDTNHPYLYALKVTGPAKFTHPIQGVMRKATATANWNSAASTVAATDDTTNNAIAITLYSNCPGRQPNVRNGDTVYYSLLPNGTCVAESSDDRIGTVRWITDIATLPGGWQVADGTNGTVNLVGRFPKGHATVSGTAGGASTHTHTISGSTGSTAPSLTINNAGTLSLTVGSTTSTGSVSGSYTDYAVTGITIDSYNHGTHQHSLSTTVEVQSGTGVVVSDAVITETTDLGSHSHGITEPTNGGAGTGHLHGVSGLSITMNSHTHTGTAADHNHTGTAASHSHAAGTLAGDSANHEPLSCTVIPIQRVD